MKTQVLFIAEIDGLNMLHSMVLYTFYHFSYTKFGIQNLLWKSFSAQVFTSFLGLNYDGSQVPAEWFGWLHYKTDLIPTNDPSRPNYKWMAKHTENMSGTSGQFMPYTTTRPKVEPWIPNK